MTAKRLAKALKEIEETTLLVDYLLAGGLELDLFCACLHLNCQECRSNDQLFFSERKVREAKEWRHGKDG